MAASSEEEKTNNEDETEYYKLDVGRLPDELFRKDVPVEKWLARCETAGKQGFAENSLNEINDALETDVHLERLGGITVYIAMNVFPFLIPVMILLYIFVPSSRTVVHFLIVYMITLCALEIVVWNPYFCKKYKRTSWDQEPNEVDQMKYNQYAFTERNNAKYCSMKFVWPKALQRNNKAPTKNMIFCMVPHGVLPFGVTAYPYYSKLFNDRLCRWTAAPVVLTLPWVGNALRQMGYIPAKSSRIVEVLDKREENVGIILDGIAGMFRQSAKEERAYLKKRKGIVKIALRSGTPLVPVYGFGHTSTYTVVVDPFGIMEKLSLALDTSLTPFFGRWGWFLGPPRRVPLAVCLGNPVVCPKVESPTQEQIDEYHQKLLDAYQELFDTHKKAYGWGNKTLKFV